MLSLENLVVFFAKRVTRLCDPIPLRILFLSRHVEFDMQEEAANYFDGQDLYACEKRKYPRV